MGVSSVGLAVSVCVCVLDVVRKVQFPGSSRCCVRMHAP